MYVTQDAVNRTERIILLHAYYDSLIYYTKVSRKRSWKLQRLAGVATCFPPATLSGQDESGFPSQKRNVTKSWWSLLLGMGASPPVSLSNNIRKVSSFHK